MAKCEVCLGEINPNNQKLTCEVCIALAHSLCVTHSLVAKWTCQHYLDIKPAHVLMCLTKYQEEFNLFNTKLTALETSQNYIANCVKSFSSSFINISDGMDGIFTNVEKVRNDLIELEKISKDNNSQSRENTKKITHVDAGVKTLLSVFDSDETLPSATLAPSIDKILVAIEGVKKSVNLTLTTPAVKIPITKSVATSTDPTSVAISSGPPLRLSNRFAVLDIDEPILVVAPSPPKRDASGEWGIIGEKEVWKYDWSYFDKKQERQKTVDKQHRRMRHPLRPRTTPLRNASLHLHRTPFHLNQPVHSIDTLP